MELNGIYRQMLQDNMNISRDLINPAVEENIEKNLDNGFSFKETLNDAINKVNDKQIEADDITMNFIMGKEEDLHKVMIKTEEARLSLELAVQVRNKLIEAYREINNMQL